VLSWWWGGVCIKVKLIVSYRLALSATSQSDVAVKPPMSTYSMYWSQIMSKEERKCETIRYEKYKTWTTAGTQTD